MQQNMRQALMDYMASLDYQVNTTHMQAFKAGWRAYKRQQVPQPEVGHRYVSQVLRELGKFVPQNFIDLLRINCDHKGSIAICNTVDLIMADFDGPVAVEIQIVVLLQKLLKIHFS